MLSRTVDDGAAMADDAIVLALANPEPELTRDHAVAGER
jgi:malic enzyme